MTYVTTLKSLIAEVVGAAIFYNSSSGSFQLLEWLAKVSEERSALSHRSGFQWTNGLFIFHFTFWNCSGSLPSWVYLCGDKRYDEWFYLVASNRKETLWNEACPHLTFCSFWLFPNFKIIMKAKYFHLIWDTKLTILAQSKSFMNENF